MAKCDAQVHPACKKSVFKDGKCLVHLTWTAPGLGAPTETATAAVAATAAAAAAGAGSRNPLGTRITAEYHSFMFCCGYYLFC